MRNNNIDIIYSLIFLVNLLPYLISKLFKNGSSVTWEEPNQDEFIIPYLLSNKDRCDD